MKSKIVNVFSDNDLRLTFSASHPKRRDFVKDWVQCLDEIKAKYPDDWTVTNVIADMNKRGWTLQQERTIEVGY